jgi:hypothetical protein
MATGMHSATPSASRSSASIWRRSNPARNPRSGTGARIAADVPVYPDDDLAAAVTSAGRQWVHKDGSPYSEE